MTRYERLVDLLASLERVAIPGQPVALLRGVYGDLEQPSPEHAQSWCESCEAKIWIGPGQLEILGVYACPGCVQVYLDHHPDIARLKVGIRPTS